MNYTMIKKVALILAIATGIHPITAHAFDTWFDVAWDASLVAVDVTLIILCVRKYEENKRLEDKRLTDEQFPIIPKERPIIIHNRDNAACHEEALGMGSSNDNLLTK